jgi:hypothetical protein
MATKKRSAKKRKSDVGSSSEDSHELEIILDRLSVQRPEGESLKHYIQSLSRAMTGRDGLVAALLEKLSKNPTEVGFQVFTALSGVVESKEHRRTIKQAAYRFAQRGFGAESGTSSPEKVVLIPKEARKPVAHLICSPETFWLVLALVPESDYSAYSSPIAISAYPEEGFQKLSVRVVETSQRSYRDFVQKIGGELSHNAVEIPMWHAARLYFELVEFCERRGNASEIERARQLLQPFHDTERLPYAFELMPAIDDPGRRLRAIDKNALLEAVVSESILLRESDLQPYAEKLKELEKPLLVVPPEVQQDRIMDLMRKAADELCVGKTRLLYQRLFEEQALTLKLASRDDLAMSAWIVAQHLRSDAKAGENPVVVELVSGSIEKYWPGEFEGQEESEETEPYKKTDSGLILLK